MKQYTIETIFSRFREEGTVFDIKNKNTLSMDWLDGNKAVDVHFHEQSANAFSTKELHAHDYFELLYMYRGQGIQYFETGSCNLKEGEIYLLNTNVKHGIYVEGEEDILINILIRPSFLSKEFISILSENDVLSRFFSSSLFQNNTEQLLHFEGNESSNTKMLFKQLIEEWAKEEIYYQSVMKSYLMILFTELLRNHTYHVHFLGREKREFSEILSYVSTHLLEVTLQELAEEFHYHPNYLSKLFRRHTNKSFSQLVNELKLEKACYYLASTSLSIDEIIEVMKYYDRSYFYKIFRKAYGMKPTEYRKDNWKNTEELHPVLLGKEDENNQYYPPTSWRKQQNNGIKNGIDPYLK